MVSIPTISFLTTWLLKGFDSWCCGKLIQALVVVWEDPVERGCVGVEASVDVCRCSEWG